MNDEALKSVILTGRVVRLEPLSLAHFDQLVKAARYPELWLYTRTAPLDTPSAMRDQIMRLLEAQRRGTDLPFATLDVRSGTCIGMTRFMDIQKENRSLEIGGTFITPAFQHTPANTEAKYLMLQYAFEQWHCLRVQFKTDLRNTISQKAIEKLGAVREGILRDHIILSDGYLRSSVYYSILAGEWPEVKRRLQERLESMILLPRADRSIR